MQRSLFVILLISILLSCGKDELAPVLDNECSNISTFNHERDFLEIYGNSLLFRNINNQQQKEFKYSFGQSSVERFSDTILCTHLTYDSRIKLHYLWDNDDHIEYNITQYYDSWTQEIEYNLNIPLYRLNGKDITETRYLSDNIRLGFIDFSNYMLLYVNDEGILSGYDDLNGEQWVINSGSSDMFYCKVEDNFDNYKETEEFSLFTDLENSPLNFSDGFTTTASFQYSSQNIYHRYNTIEDNDCPEQSLFIDQTTEMALEFSFGNIYNLFLSFSPYYQNGDRDKKYVIIRLYIYYQREGKSLHDATLVINPENNLDHNYITSSPHIFHETITLNEIEFKEVYEFTIGDRSLFFNYDHGIIAFTDHLGIINYLRVD